MVVIMGGHGQNRHGHVLHLHLPSLSLSFGGGRTSKQEVAPKGCMAIQVGDEQQRFVVPVGYLTHPLFLGLLKEAEEVYGFDHKGAISIPCQVDQFMHVQSLIHKQQHHHHHHFHLTTCFSFRGGGGGGGLKAS